MSEKKENNCDINSSGFETELLKKYAFNLIEEGTGLIANTSIFLWVRYLILEPKLLKDEQRPTKVIILRKTIEYDYENFPEFCFGLLEIELMKKLLFDKQVKDKRFYIIGYRKIKLFHQKTERNINVIEIYYAAFYQTPINFFSMDVDLSEDFIYTFSLVHKVFNLISDYLEGLNGNYFQNSNSKYGCFSLRKKEECLSVYCELEYVNEEIKNIFYTTFKDLNAIILKSEIEKKELSWIIVCFGRLLNTINDFENSLTEFTKALSLRNLLYGEVHQDVADCIEKIGITKMNLKKHEEALTLFKQVYEIRSKCLPESDPRISDAFYNIGTAYLRLQNIIVSREYFEKSLYILEIIKKRNEIIFIIDLKISNSLQGIAYIFHANKQWKKVLEILLEALQINLQYFDYDCAKIAFLTEKISYMFRNIQEEVRAFEYGIRTYKSFSKLYGKDKKTSESIKFLRELKSYNSIKRLIFLLHTLRKKVKIVFKRKIIIEDILFKFI